MEICDLQYIENGDMVEITFCSTETWEDVLKIKLSMRDMWQIKDYCQERLSYGAAKKGIGLRRLALI